MTSKEKARGKEMKKHKGRYGKKSRTSLKKRKKEENRKSWRPKK
jgi:hypothetical protein